MTTPDGRLDRDGFAVLVHRLAAAWSGGDASTATSCFATDVVYVEPPDRQRYVGHDDLYELSGGGQPPPMTFTVRHLVFDPQTQIGSIEYTFRGRRQYHGIAIVQCAGAVITRWREYQRQSDLDWTAFVGDSRFPDSRTS
jgi:hypothetical protein